ncbi:MAG: PPOX class F420-dependent oxidoreductase [Conexivisphaera sp.]
MSLEELRGRKYLLLTTFRRDGTPVGTTVLFALDDDRILVHTSADSGKVKRLRRNPRALVQPSTILGRPLGPPIEVMGRVLEGEEAREAARILRSCCLEKRLSMMLDPLRRSPPAYLELRPTRAEGARS